MHLFSALLLAAFSGTSTLPYAPLQTSSAEHERYSLREAWIGSIKVGPFEAVLQFRVEANTAGTTRAYFDSISEKRTDRKSVV